ncbi:MAG: endonuclease/exonuclease/phosphatase family protein [Sciscionella sp.]
MRPFPAHHAGVRRGDPEQAPDLATTNHQITRLSTQDPNARPRPAPGFAEAVVLVHGKPVHVYATHLDFRPDPAVRTTQVDEMLRIMAGDGPHAQQVLLGDLNAEPTAPELAPLWRRLTDAGRYAPDGSFTYPAEAPTSRIDYAAVSGRIGVLAASVPDSVASDHRPMVADLVPHGF